MVTGNISSANLFVAASYPFVKDLIKLSLLLSPRKRTQKSLKEILSLLSMGAKKSYKFIDINKYNLK
jgi:hypothetical protein